MLMPVKITIVYIYSLTFSSIIYSSILLLLKSIFEILSYIYNYANIYGVEICKIFIINIIVCLLI